MVVGSSVAGLGLWAGTDVGLTAAMDEDSTADTIGVGADLSAAAGNAELICRWIVDGSLDGPFTYR